MCLSHCKDVSGCPFHGIVDPNAEKITLDEDDSLDLMPTDANSGFDYEDLPPSSQSCSSQPFLSQDTHQSLPPPSLLS